MSGQAVSIRQVHQISHECREAIILALCPTERDLHILALDVTSLAQPLLEGGITPECPDQALSPAAASSFR